MNNSFPLDNVLEGNCIEVMERFPAESIDLVFADPPYNLQLRQELWRPNQTRVNGVNDAWDQFSSFEAYDSFTRAWLTACRRVLKPTGSLWVIGTYHNIHRVGTVLQDLGYWILNSVVWVKANPMPNFRGVRFTNAHETLLWAQKQAGNPYTFNHHAMKALNDDLQMRSDWYLPICNGHERLQANGKKAHATQKPEALLYRIIMAASNPGNIILDPFFGTGTTGVVAQKLQRHWVGIEQEPGYVQLARERIAAEKPAAKDPAVFHTLNPRRLPRLPFGALLEAGFLQPGQLLFFGKNGPVSARIQADGSLVCDGQRGSIHQIARLLQQGPSNGWQQWHYEDKETGQRQPIDHLRQLLRSMLENQNHEEIIK